MSVVVKKYIVAITGVMLFGFVFVHLVGNLQIYLGTEKINFYAKTLADLGPLLWIARVTLLIITLFHVFFAVNLHYTNAQARDVPYAKQVHQVASFSSRHMSLSGMVILFFILYHLAHFTLRWTHPEFRLLAADHDVYRMVVLGFQNIPVSVFYVLSMFVLGLHLHHALASAFQTFGVYPNRRAVQCIQWGAKVLTGLVVVGNISIPVSVLLKIIQ